MLEIARKDRDQRSDLFVNTGYAKNMSPAVVEKDFWVCYVLDHLFHRSMWKDSLVFKGGTSLSKAFHVIERFSEDIDIVLDWRLLDCGNALAWSERSRNQQDKFDRQMIDKASAFLSTTFVDSIRKSIST